MKYIAILGYDCGCAVESNYGFVREVRFDCPLEQVGQRLERFKERKSRSDEGHPCRRVGPVEILVLDEHFKLVDKWRKKNDK